MDENKGTTTPADAVTHGEESPGDVAHVVESAGAEVALAVDAMLDAVITAAAAQSETVSPDVSTRVADLSSQEPKDAGQNHEVSVSEPAEASEPGSESVDLPTPRMNAAGIADEAPNTSESVAAGVDAMLASTTVFHDGAVDANGVVLSKGVAGIADDATATTENHAPDVEAVLLQTAELHDEAARVNDAATPEVATVVAEELKETSESEPASVDSAGAENGSATEVPTQEVMQETRPETMTEAAAQAPPAEAPVAAPAVVEAVSSTSATESATVEPDAAITAAGSTADEESFGEFENPDDLIKRANKQEAAARAASQQEATAVAGTLTDLDASLAQNAEKAMGPDGAGGSTPIVAAQPTAPAPKKMSAATLVHRESPAEASVAGMAAPGSKAPVASAGSGAASSEVRASEKRPNGAAVVQTIRRVIKPVPGIAMKALVPVAVRYERLGAEKHKLVKILAIGHIVMAASIWGYLMFGRTTDQAAIEAAANAKAGAVHPIAASLPGSHSADHTGHGHGASEAPSSDHESHAPSHGPEEKHEDAGTHAEKTGHGH